MVWIPWLYREVDGDDVSEPLAVVEEGGEVADDHDQRRRDVHRHQLDRQDNVLWRLVFNTRHSDSV